MNKGLGMESDNVSDDRLDSMSGMYRWLSSKFPLNRKMAPKKLLVPL